MNNYEEKLLIKDIYKYLGAHQLEDRWVFRVWAPNAKKVSVVGDFNGWNSEIDIMKLNIESGVWELEIKNAKKMDLYKFSIEDTLGRVQLKSDPYAFYSQYRPDTASVLYDLPKFNWSDNHWEKMESTKKNLNIPMNIYEVHLGSWARGEGNKFLNYKELAHRLVHYVKDMNYTHVEIMPISEYPLDDSWGYQITGYFSVTSRYGTPEDFMYFVDYMHKNGIKIILDWVPGHFCKDDHGLYRFDGSALYEYENSVIAENPQWGTSNFDFSKKEVVNFLISNALYWIKEFHIDGIRIDAIANILYMNFGRGESFNIKNIHGGDENLEGVKFLSNLNEAINYEFPNAMVFAEDSTDWPFVTKSVKDGGLGFDFKWNMGWMNDTLKYISYDPIYRSHHHNNLTFSFMYMFSENYILPISHDEVVHGKNSILNKMPGDFLEKLLNLKLYLAYMISHPGKKLNFMGNELAQGLEWRFTEPLEWHVLENNFNREYHEFVRSLNRLYLDNPAFWEKDFESSGLKWISTHRDDNTLAFVRYGDKKNDFIVCFFNFSNRLYSNHGVGVPRLGLYREIYNSYSPTVINPGDLYPIQRSIGDAEYQLEVKVPPLTAIFFKGSFRR